MKQEIGNAKCVREDPLQQDSGLIPKGTVAKKRRSTGAEESTMKIKQHSKRGKNPN